MQPSAPCGNSADAARMAASPTPDPLAALPESLRALALRGAPRRYRSGTLVIGEGERDDTIYIVLRGRLRVFSCNERDREIEYGTYGPGEYVGEMSLDGGPRSANVEAVGPTDCVMVTRQTLLAHIAANPEFALELLTKVIRRARAATLSARQMALNDVYGRLALVLDSRAERRPDGCRWIAERLTHHKLAGLVGCSREMVSRVMKDLERGGYVRAENGGIWLAPTLPSRW